MTHITSAVPLSSTEAFARIGTLMTNWMTRLSERDIARNSVIRTELETLGRSTSYAQQRSNASRIAVLNASVKAVRTIARLKSTIPALACVLDGSPKMDTGAALMLLAQHADFSVPEDETASDVLIGLIRTARSAPVPPLPTPEATRRPKP